MSIWDDIRSWPGYLVLGLRKMSVWLRVVRIFLAPLGVLLVLLVALTVPDQGPDAVRMMHEPPMDPPKVPFIHLPRLLWGEMAVLLLAITLWYMARLLAYAYDKKLRRTPRIRLHLPRFLGFSCFNALLMGQFCAGVYGKAWTSGAALGVFFLVGVLQYTWLHRAFRSWREGWRTDTLELAHRVRVARLLLSSAMILCVLLMGGPFDADTRLGASADRILGLLCHLALQTMFLYYLNRRRDWSRILDAAEKLEKSSKAPERSEDQRRIWWGFRAINGFFRQVMADFQAANKELMKGLKGKQSKNSGAEEDLRIDDDEGFLKLYIVYGMAVLATFITASFHVGLAMRLGTVCIVAMGLTVILAVLGIAQLISELKRVSVLAFTVVVALLLGQFADPHELYSPVKPLDEKREFGDRLTLEEKLRGWYAERAGEIAASKNPYPMFFVLADGGASRSGYWVETVLGRLHDSTGRGPNGFARHLFCLSGASGGSVGTGTYFALLAQEKYTGKQCDSMMVSGRRILRHDLLSPTLASMLGADLVNFVLPVAGIPDRARALERALQFADDGSWAHDGFSRRMSELATHRSDTARVNGLPIMHINTTRMQDGRPAVISTIDVSEPFYNGRVDVLDLLPLDEDMELATAVITGARFPYVSPAGSIHSELHGDHYFVDGGYFDNSGAGITHETIAQIFSTGNLLKEVVPDSLQGRIRPYVIHIGNSRLVEPEAGVVSPFANDIAAPITTMLGAYGMQTDVNDRRLKTLLDRKYSDTLCYLDVQLYRDSAENECYPMSWAMSDSVRKAMDTRLKTHDKVNALINWMRSGYEDTLRPVDKRKAPPREHGGALR